MKVLVTGAKGFIGKNLIAELERLDNVTVFGFDVDTESSLLDEYCKDCDFVFNLAGVNRPETVEEFMEGNFGFATTLVETLKKYNVCHCCYGHLHGPTIRRRLEGNRGGIEFSLISADYLEFIPKKICE